MPILEAMACGKPVVNIGENGFATLINDKTVSKAAYYNFSGRHLRYYPKMGSPLIDEIIKIAGNVNIYDQLSKFSLQYVKENYDVESGANKLIKIYTEMVDSKNAPSFWALIYYIINRVCFSIKIRFNK